MTVHQPDILPRPDPVPAIGTGAWLAHSRSILKALLGETDDIVYVKDAHGRYLAINAAAAEVVGLPPEEIIGRDDREVLAADTAGRVMARDREVLEAGQALSYENVDFEGEQRRVFFTSKVPFTDETGNVVGLICIARDVTQHRRAEEQRRLLAVLQERTRLARELHDSATQSLFSASMLAQAAQA
jgi:two-component system sensor histidine kinase/response regulator